MADETFNHDYFEMLKREHRELGGAIHVAKDAFAAGAADPNAIREAIGHLCQLVKSHFAHEEEGGYMREAIQRAPRITKRAEKLLEEHEMMLAAIKELCETARRADDAEITSGELKSAFTAFINELSQHEAGENSILQEAYTDDIGTKD